MQEELKITIIQSDLFWEDAASNRFMFEGKINSVDENTDLIVLPEMFTTGFSMNASLLAEKENDESLFWMKEQAKNKNCAITGSIIVSENQKYYNRLLFVYPNGEYITYNKRHAFTLAGEHLTYQPGNERLIVELLGWKICPLICYDLRFPVWARNTCDFDVLLYVANWPEKRINAWDALLKARAIENMVYCIGVNRTGNDGNGHKYNGHSAAYDVLGEMLTTKNLEENYTETLSLKKSHIKSNRKHLQFLNDRDKFTLG